MQVNRPTDQQIRQRAYEIFVQSGRKPGYEVDNWLQAEYELMQLPVRKIAEMEPPRTKPDKVGKGILDLKETIRLTLPALKLRKPLFEAAFSANGG